MNKQFGFNEPASQYIPKPSAVSTGELTDSPKFQEELSKPNNLGDMLNSPEMIKMQEDLADAHKKSVDSSVGWYYNLSSEDKYKAVEALCHIICKAEHQGTSHRGLMDTLGIYPEAFWISELMDLHNSMWTYYHDKKQIKDFEEDIKTTFQTGTVTPPQHPNPCYDD